MPAGRLRARRVWSHCPALVVASLLLLVPSLLHATVLSTRAARTAARWRADQVEDGGINGG
jgi:hypothetical protein